MLNKLPKYLTYLIKNNPKLTSGRKNYEQQHKRLIKQIYILKKYLKGVSKDNE